MNKTKLFLYDFVTNKKIIKYLVAVSLFFSASLYYSIENPNFTLGDGAMANIGLSMAFMTTLYGILSYATLDRIKAYLMLPCEKAEVFFAFIFAQFFSLVLERMSFVFVIAVFFTKVPFLLIAYLMLSALIAVVLDTVIIMCLNKKKRTLLIVCIALILLLYVVLTFSQNHIANFIVLVVVLVTSFVFMSRFEPKHLAISRESKAKSNSFKRYNYFFIVMLREKTALINTGFVFAFAVGFAFIAKETPILLNVIWCIFAVNTPITTMFSGDKSLMRQERMLPRNSRLMSGVYGYFLCVYFAITNSVGILLFMVMGQFNITILITAIVLVGVETSVALLLERKYPICSWQKKQEVWRNPRKYVLPAIAFVAAALPLLLKSLLQAA